MIKAIQCNINHTHTFKEVEDLSEVSDLIKDKSSIIWLDLLQPGVDEMQRVAEEFNFHPLAVEDAMHPHQRPKIDQYEKFFFVVFYAIEMDSKKHHLTKRELNLFVGENYLVTVHSQEIKELKEAEERWKRNAAQIERGVGVLIYSILDTIVDNYFPVLDVLVERAENLEEQIFRGKAGEAQFTSKLLHLKKLFLQMRRVAGPERDILNVLTNRDSPIFNESTLIYFRDVFDHILRVSDTLDLYRDQVSSSMDANLSVASNELNKIMRTLTVASVILMTDALVAGIYGMNFDNIPELHLPYGYFGALALMVGLSVGLFLFFKRQKWL